MQARRDMIGGKREFNCGGPVNTLKAELLKMMTPRQVQALARVSSRLLENPKELDNRRQVPLEEKKDRPPHVR